MTKKLFYLAVFCLLVIPGRAQKTENIILFAMDGMRWQEIFGGVDSVLMEDRAFTQERKQMRKDYWATSPAERRRRLMPFFWDTIALRGQLYGNRNLGNDVDVANPYKITYAGFSEVITGNPDSAIKSNALVIDKNTNVLEVIDSHPAFKGKVAVFSTSDLFPYILDKWRNGLYVNSDTDTTESPLLNRMERLTAEPTGERPDLLTYFAAREYLLSHHPRILYVALGETDAYAHMGSYDQYISVVHAEDAMIADFWATVQSMPQYRGKTTLIAFCDHGRGGAGTKEWTDHGDKIAGSGNIWIAAMGPDSAPLGEVSRPEQLYQGQVAATIAALLGIRYTPPQKVLPPIESVYK
ncbi:phosphoglyceromutase [Dinghuibacter silviterrae]|uniref:Type I phosphodiesterase/nucleotide pyrophosphatase n=1 Tax=Dinghuibacter silviterrae TaxID=1539049 RepID=A0A4R8DEC8_9BACT|nr:phosphoglyceromutase [Dinghuibacter silviterrae]TDW95881.1 hypothetical protein EDB95_3702 [Dinghuibacter silviterrae]